MEIKVVVDDIVNVRAGAIIVNYFEDLTHLEGDTAAVDKALDGAISQLIKQGEIKGKMNEITLLHSLGKLPSSRIVVMGLGKKGELSINKVQGALAETCRMLRQKGVDNVAIGAQVVGIDGIEPESAAQAVTEGVLLGLYTFRRHMTKKENNSGEIKELLIVSNSQEKPQLQQGIGRGRILAEATNWARDMVNEPGNYMTPSQMADAARQLAKTCGLEVEVLEREQMAAAGMGALLGVAQGSQQPPKFIVLNYKGTDFDVVDVALVGKGITFDTGGISIKPSEGMLDMKRDKSGGAAVMAAVSAVARLKAKINVMAVVPATENMPSGSALKPGDVLTAMNGKTIEVISTDAEGRLILADALSYARKLGTRFIIDAASLTGACRVALGTICSGVFGNNQELTDKLIAAGSKVGEPAWQLPMYDEYNEHLKSDIADIKNMGGRYAGAITAAKFLAEFVDGTPWVHMDIAGTREIDKDRGYLVKGATGIPTRTLVNLVLSLVK